MGICLASPHSGSSNKYPQSMTRAKFRKMMYALEKWGSLGSTLYEPRREKPLFGVSDQVRHKPGYVWARWPGG